MIEDILEEQDRIACQLHELTKSPKAWELMTVKEKTPYLNQAQGLMENESKILSQLLSKYAVKFGLDKKYQKVVMFIVGAVLATLASLGLQSCGHSIDITQDKTSICKDGSCVVLEPGHLSFSQKQPEIVTQPILVSQTK